MFIPSNERAVGKEMSNPQVTGGGDIKKNSNANSHQIF
jgi:hypothetical protein